MRRLAWSVGALVSALVAAPALGATVVVHPAELDPAAVGAAWAEQFGRAEVPRLVSIDAVFPPEQSVVLLGDARATECTATRRPSEELGQLNDRVIDQITEMDYLPAAATLALGEALLPCLSGAPPPDVLGRHHFMRGVVAYYAEGPEVAVERFEEALLVAPFLQWDPRVPPGLKPSFDAAIAGALSAGRAFVSVSPRILETGRLWMDGLPVDPRTRTTSIYAGTHLVQWLPEGRELQGWAVSAKEGQSIRLEHRQDAAAGLLAARADPETTRYARDRVLAPVERQEGALAVAQEDELLLFHRWDDGAQEWRVADVAALLTYRQRGRATQRVGAVMTGGGVGLALTGLVAAFFGLVDGSFVRDEIRESPSPLETYTALASEYARAQQIVRVGWTFTFVGGAVAIAGVPTQAIGARRARRASLPLARPSAPRSSKR